VREHPIQQLPDDEFLAELSRRYNAMPQEVLENRELVELFLPPLRADLKLLENWSYQEDAPLECPVSAFGGLQDPSVERDELAAWDRQTRSTFRLLMLPGGHLFVKDASPPLLQVISNSLRPYLRG
jgi:medium-chain acyl-[acyl-carrier-protein] hydrolase